MRHKIGLFILTAAVIIGAAVGLSSAVRAQDSNTPCTISFHTEPRGAEVFLDDVRLGKTPLLYWSTHPGKHTIRFKKAGFQTLVMTVNAPTGGTLVIRRHLHP